MKRWISLLMVLMLCFSMAVPAASVEAESSSRVTVVYKGKTKTFKNKKTYAYVNDQKIKATKMPIFMKSGCYMGPVNKLFKNSSLKVKVKGNSTTLTMQYMSNIVVMRNGSRVATVNGEQSTMGAPAMRVTYPNGKTKWVVPLKSICSRLGITYKLKGGVVQIKGATNTVTTSAAPAEEAPQNTGQIVLILDAGHGGIDSGATGNGYREKSMTLDILLGAKRMFDQDSRFKVYYTRTSDTYPSLTDRSDLANSMNADLFVSIHINSASASAHGTETLYNSSRNTVTARNGLTSRDLATYIQRSVVATTGFVNRGLKNRTDLSVLNRTKMPACLIEYGFISNAQESKTMNANTARYGQELYQAIVGYLQSEGRL